MTKPVYTGPPGFESDSNSDSDDEDQIDHELLEALEALRQEPDESEYVNVSGMVDFDAFILEQQQSVDFQPEREHFRIDELKTENTFWSETVFSHTSADSKYPQKNTDGYKEYIKRCRMEKYISKYT